LLLKNKRDLSSNREDWLTWLLDTRRQSGNDDVYDDGKERREQSGKRVVHTTVLVDLDDLVNQPPDQVHPRQSGGEGKTRDDRVEGLRFEFTSNERNSFGCGRHFLYYRNRFYSGNKSSSNKIFLYFFVFLRYPFNIFGLPPSYSDSEDSDSDSDSDSESESESS